MSEDRSSAESAAVHAAAGVLPAETSPGPGNATDGLQRATSLWVDRFDRWTEWAGERTNPILIKEARQALKSHHFITSFMLLLLGAWGWSFIAILAGLPEIAYNGGGRGLLIGYQWLLILPLMLIVPFSAFRSLASEREDGTFELMSITSLNARMIVTGKLASAVLQILLYASALAPGISFTYLLRGVDVAVIVFVLYYTLLLSVLLSAAALLVATLSRARHWQVLMSIILIAGLFLAVFAWGMTSSQLIYMQDWPINPASDAAWTVHTALTCGAVSFGVLIIQAAASRITFAGDNRSTRQRVTVAVQFAIWVGWIGYGFWVTKDTHWLRTMQLVAGCYAAFVGAWFIGESPSLSPRVRRELPRSVFGRILFTLFNPGSGTGYLYTAATLTAVTAVSVGLHLAGQAWGASGNAGFGTFAVLIWAYVLSYLGLARLVWLLCRRSLRVPGEMAPLLLVLLAILGIAMPLAVAAVLENGSYIEYETIQASNWAWTLARAVDRDLCLSDPAVVLIVLGVAGVVMLANMPTAAREVAKVMDSD